VRIASFVLGLVFSFIVLGASLFSFFASILGAGIGKFTESEKIASEAASFLDAGGYGLLLAILGIIGASLTLRYRAAPTILLLLTAVGLILVGTYTLYKDMAVFGGLFILPAIFIAVSKRKK